MSGNKITGARGLTVDELLAFHKAHFGDARMDATDKGDDGLLAGSLDDLRGRTPEELQRMLTVLDAHLRALHQTEEGELRDKTDDEQAAFDTGVEIRDEIVKRIENHNKVSEIFRRRPETVKKAYDSIRLGLDSGEVASVVRLTNREAREKALRVLGDGRPTLRDDEATQVDKLIRSSTDIARRVIVTENEAYRDAWHKLVTNPHANYVLSEEERDAVRAWEEYRAMAEGTNSAGGFGIPVFIDPSIILTAQGSGNPFLAIAKQVDVNTNAWKGVSSAGVSWSFDAEASAVSDDSPTLAQPKVDVFTARGFIPYSIEVGEDYPGFASEMSALLASGYDELLVDKFTRGSGTGEPQGIVTALDADTTVEVLLATAGTLAAADIYNVWAKLPQRFRRGASWLGAVDINNKIRQLGTANNFHATTVQLSAGSAEVLMNRQWYETPYMTDLTSSGVHTNVAVVGDFSNYVVARRGGMSVELVPQLFDVTNNRPTGQRGWFAYARIGGGSANNQGFRLLNQT
jgi:HK97 family phage major capsid protein